MKIDLRMHSCNREDSWTEYDGHGIYLCRVCDVCEETKMAGFRSDIHERYDADEQIEEDN